MATEWGVVMHGSLQLILLLLEIFNQVLNAILPCGHLQTLIFPVGKKKTGSGGFFSGNNVASLTIQRHAIGWISSIHLSRVMLRESTEYARVECIIYRFGWLNSGFGVGGNWIGKERGDDAHYVGTWLDQVGTWWNQAAIWLDQVKISWLSFFCLL